MAQTFGKPATGNYPRLMMPFAFSDKDAESAYLELMAAIRRNDGVECASYPDIFMPNDWEMGNRADDVLAKTVCNRCPVKNQCLEYAMVAEDELGTWGGLTQHERRQLRSLARQSANPS
jgi:WhiB family redox-sensing transcriptional regulator